MKSTVPDSVTQVHEVSMPVGQTILRVLGWLTAWFLSIKLADIQLVVAIFSGCLVAVYTGLNTYVLWRDKVRRKADDSAQ